MAPVLGLGRMNSQAFVRSVLASASLLILLYVASDSRSRISHNQSPGEASSLSDQAPVSSNQACKPVDRQPEAVLKREKYPVSDFVKGPPAPTLLENLREDRKYITTLTDAGWTNDVMTIANMIYLGLITERAAVVPPFSPSHIGYDTGDFQFGDFFDVPRMRELMNHPVLEWRDIKHQNSSTIDTMGCWSPWITLEGRPRLGRLHKTLFVDPSYTRVPLAAQMPLDQHFFNLWGLAKLGFPQGRAEALQDTTPLPSVVLKLTIPPDETFLCFDMLYYAGVYDIWEWEKDWSPVWRFVGRHMRFNPKMIELAEVYLRKAFRLNGNEPIPEFIAIHARRGDFAQYCDKEAPLDYCVPPLSVWQQHVNKLRAKLKARTGVSIAANSVYVLSDEKDPKWWAEVDKLGWTYMDHDKEKTIERYGSLWYPSLIDAVIQAMGKGFLGTDKSTMSLVALLRTIDWNDGEGWMVTFGRDKYKPNANGVVVNCILNGLVCM